MFIASIEWEAVENFDFVFEKNYDKRIALLNGSHPNTGISSIEKHFDE